MSMTMVELKIRVFDSEGLPLDRSMAVMLGDGDTIRDLQVEVNGKKLIVAAGPVVQELMNRA